MFYLIATIFSVMMFDVINIYHIVRFIVCHTYNLIRISAYLVITFLFITFAYNFKKNAEMNEKHLKVNF